MQVATGYKTRNVKRMTAKEFRALGLLQEMNRLFLHPMGLALEVVVDDDGNERFGEVWNCIDDPQGMIYNHPPSTEKEDVVTAMFEAKRQERMKSFGWHVQPTEEQK